MMTVTGVFAPIMCSHWGPLPWVVSPTADVCHVNGTKHGLDLSIVGIYITFAQCKMFITMTVIILCKTF